MMFPQTPFAGVHNNLGVVGGGNVGKFSHNPFAPDPRPLVSSEGSLSSSNNFHPMFNNYRPVAVLPHDANLHGIQKNPPLTRRRSGSNTTGLQRIASSHTIPLESAASGSFTLGPEWFKGMLSPSGSRSASMRQLPSSSGKVTSTEELRAAGDRAHDEAAATSSEGIRQQGPPAHNGMPPDESTRGPEAAPNPSQVSTSGRGSCVVGCREETVRTVRSLWGDCEDRQEPVGSLWGACGETVGRLHALVLR